MLLDLVIVAFIGLSTYWLSAEGLFGASLKLINVMLSGLIAFSAFEPCARMLQSWGLRASYTDFVSVAVLFFVIFLALDTLTAFLSPVYVQFHGLVDSIGRFAFAAATSWYFVAILLCMVQTAPVHKQFLGYRWRTHALWTVGIDRHWLGFVQASTQRFFEWDPPRPFDPKSDFIIRYHQFRPFGEADPDLPGGAAAQPSPGGGPAR